MLIRCEMASASRAHARRHRVPPTRRFIDGINEVGTHVSVLCDATTELQVQLDRAGADTTAVMMADAAARLKRLEGATSAVASRSAAMMSRLNACVVHRKT